MASASCTRALSPSPMTQKSGFRVAKINSESLVINLVLAAIFCLLLVLLIMLKGVLLVAHTNTDFNGNADINFVSSDASNYYTIYETLYADAELVEHPELYFIGSPILFMKLSDGNLFLIQFCQLLLMVVSLKVGADCFTTFRARLAFIAGALIFPYFLFGFLSLNKEIYSMCAAIFFASYFMRGKRWHLVVALILAMIARYYMAAALVALLFLVPRVSQPRYWRIGVLLVFISIMAPLAKFFVPHYGTEGLLDAPGFTGILFSKIIDSGGYALIYPIKYLTLIPMRAYSYFIDASRMQNALEGFVSFATLTVLLLALYIVLLKKPTSALVKRFILIA